MWWKVKTRLLNRGVMVSFAFVIGRHHVSEEKRFNAKIEKELIIKTCVLFN